MSLLLNMLSRLVITFLPRSKHLLISWLQSLSAVILELAIQRTLTSLLQHHYLKVPVLQCSVFFMVQYLHPYMTTRKAIALTIWSFVSKVTYMLFNMLSKFVITFFPRSKCLLILWLQVTVHSDFGAQENKICHCFHFLTFYLPWSDGTRSHDLHFLNVEF